MVRPLITQTSNPIRETIASPFSTSIAKQLFDTGFARQQRQVTSAMSLISTALTDPFKTLRVEPLKDLFYELETQLNAVGTGDDQVAGEDPAWTLERQRLMFTWCVYLIVAAAASEVILEMLFEYPLATGAILAVTGVNFRTPAGLAKRGAEYLFDTLVGSGPDDQSS